MMKMHSLGFAGCLLLSAVSLTVNAAAYTNLGHEAGAQCETSGINDSGIAVGNCTPASASANNVPWLADTNTENSQVALKPLVAEQPCRALNISNAGWIGGICKNANNVNTAVVWNATTPNNTPTPLKPLPGVVLPLRAADVKTIIMASNQRGDMVGWSISSNQELSTVIWLAGDDTPKRVFSSLLGLLGYNDKCVPVGVSDSLSNGYPSIAMNCPRTNGITIPQVAKANVTTYTISSLPIATGANRCYVKGINNTLQSVGYCEYPDTATNPVRTAAWMTPTTAPLTLTLSIKSKNAGRAINNSGVVLASRQDDTGRVSDLTWIPLAGLAGIQLIQPPTGAVSTQAFGIADNNTVALNSDVDQYLTGCIWSPATGGNAATTHCLASIGGGKKNWLSTFSQSGSYAGGVNLNSTQDMDAVAVELP